MLLQALKLKVLRFQGKVQNELIMTSWNGLNKSRIAIYGKSLKPLLVFELRHQIWSGYGPQNKKASEHTWQPEKGLVISSYPFCFLNFQNIFDNHISKFLSKEFLGCIDYIFSYLPKLQYVQWVTNSTQDLKILSSKPTDLLGWAFGPNPTTFSYKAQWLTSSKQAQWSKIGFGAAK